MALSNFALACLPSTSSRNRQTEIGNASTAVRNCHAVDFTNSKGRSIGARRNRRRVKRGGTLPRH